MDLNKERYIILEIIPTKVSGGDVAQLSALKINGIKLEDRFDYRLDKNKIRINCSAVLFQLHGPPTSSYCLIEFYHTDVRQITISLIIIQTVAHYKFIGNIKSGIIHMDIDHSSLGFVQQGAQT